VSFLLKIVEGPNRGAEVALVDGVAVTLGKGETCDIVLADPTLPDEPLSLEASASGVTAGGEALVPFAVKTLGATSFAVGPADAPWEPLRWPEKEVEGREAEGPKGEGPKGEGRDGEGPKGEGPAAESAAPDAPAKPERAKKRGLAFLVLAAVLLAVLLALAWFFRGSGSGTSATAGDSGEAGGAGPLAPTLEDLAGRHGLSLEGGKIRGNFATRRERLAATAELYAARPGAELDLSDDESFRTACEDALFTLTEGTLTVAAATNRVLALSGTSPSPDALARTLDALRSDLPKLRDVDVSAVSFPALAGPVAAASGVSVPSASSGDARGARPQRAAAAAAPALPVCGILTSPYPCLVMRDGRRLMEGAALGDGIILEIGADSVVVTNSAGRFTWKP